MYFSTTYIVFYSANLSSSYFSTGFPKSHHEPDECILSCLECCEYNDMVDTIVFAMMTSLLILLCPLCLDKIVNKKYLTGRFSSS